MYFKISKSALNILSNLILAFRAFRQKLRFQIKKLFIFSLILKLELEEPSFKVSFQVE